MEPGNIPASAFSPAKIIFIGLIVLVALDRIQIGPYEFLAFSLAFMIIEPFHNDYLRFKLNKWAQR